MALKSWLSILAAIAAIYVVHRYYFLDNKEAMENAYLLGTDSKSNREFHAILEDASLLNFAHDAIILCYEKVNRKRLIVKNSQHEYFSPADQYALFDIDQDLKKIDEMGLSGAKGLIRGILDDPKPIVLTHWFMSIHGHGSIGFNAYLNIKNKDYNLPNTALAEYDLISKLVKEKLNTGNYTHLIIGATGWNTLPASSLSMYNNWLTETTAASLEDQTVFKPFFIGITWPSKWMTPGLSVFNKANDADEIGMTHMNYLLWKKLLPVINSLPVKIPVITLGHSFGARLMSRSCHSRFMLHTTSGNFFIDLSIDFQGAYPVTRFCKKGGNNGGLYIPDNPVKLHVVTSSKYDIANKAPVWSVAYVGNNKSIRVLQKSFAANDFEFCRVDDSGRPVGLNGTHNKISVDAKNIVNQPKFSIGGAHSDVEDKEAGRFIWELIKQIK